MFSYELAPDLELEERTFTDKLEEFEKMTDLDGKYLDPDPWEGFQIVSPSCV